MAMRAGPVIGALLIGGGLYVGYEAVKRLRLFGQSLSTAQAAPAASGTMATQGQPLPGQQIGSLIIPPSQPPAASSGGSSQYQSVINQGGSPAEATFLAAISKLENPGGNIAEVSPKNKNGTVDYGAYQVNSGWANLIGDVQTFLHNLDLQSKAALAILHIQGPSAWTTLPQLCATSPGIVAAVGGHCG